MGELEKTVRGMIALIVISYGHYFRHFSERWSEVIFWGGIFIAFTAVFAWCPIRKAFFSESLEVVEPETSANKA